MKPTRRTMLGVLALGTVSIGGEQAYSHWLPTAPDPASRVLAERLARMPKQRGPLRSIGLSYLKNLEHRPTAEQIVEEWFPSAAERQRVLALKPLKLAEQIAARTLADYRKGRVVNVNGWLLSETEARFAALTSLMRRL